MCKPHKMTSRQAGGIPRTMQVAARLGTDRREGAGGTDRGERRAGDTGPWIQGVSRHTAYILQLHM